MTELQDCLHKLSSEDEADRICAAEDLGYANYTAAIDPLLARLQAEKSRAVRESIFGALVHIEDDAVIVGAVTLLDSSDSFLRNQSVELLRIRGLSVIPYLDRAFREGSPDRRKFVIDSLINLGGPETSAIYERALCDPDINVVITAIENLGNTRNTLFRQRVEAMLAPGGHPMLLCACLETLAQIGNAGSLDLARQCLDPVDDIPGYMLPAYLKLVGARGCKEDIPSVAAMIHRGGLEKPVLNALTGLRSRDCDAALPEDLAEPLSEIVTGIESPLLVYQAVRLLGALLHRPEVFALLVQCLANPDKTVRIAAGQTLREAGTPQAATALDAHRPAETDDEVLQAWDGEGD